MSSRAGPTPSLCHLCSRAHSNSDAVASHPLGRRAAIALSVLFVYVNATWLWAARILWSDDEVDADTGIRFVRLDWKDEEARGPFALYFAWGFVDLTISSWVYWILGTSSCKSIPPFYYYYFGNTSSFCLCVSLIRVYAGACVVASVCVRASVLRVLYSTRECGAVNVCCCCCCGCCCCCC